MKRLSESGQCTGPELGSGTEEAGCQSASSEEKLSSGGSRLLSLDRESSVEGEGGPMMPSAPPPPPSDSVGTNHTNEVASSASGQSTTILASSFKDKMKLVSKHIRSTYHPRWLYPRKNKEAAQGRLENKKVGYRWPY